MGNKVKGDGDILMVMPGAFHLGWAGATRRLFHLAEAFRSVGYNNALLAGKYTTAYVQEEIDNQFPGLVLRAHHTGAYPRMVDVAHLPRRAWRALWKARGQEYYWFQLSLGWGRNLDVDLALRTLRQQCLNPKLIWGVSCGYLDGAVAAERISRALNVPWIFELHDPPWGAGLGPDRVAVKCKFTELLHSASAIVVTAETYKEELIQKFGISEGRVHTIPLAYENTQGKITATAGDRFVLIYAGSLDGGRSLVPLLYALEQATTQTTGMALSCRLVLAGKGHGFEEVKQFTVGNKLARVVDTRGQVSGMEALVLLETANLQIIVQPAQSYLQVPGKVFESLRAGKPVLGIMPKDCEAAKILRRSGLGFIHESTDIDGIRNTLTHLWRAWKEGRSIVTPDEGYISQFSVERLPEKIRSIFNAVGIIKKFGEGENGHGS